uniref:Uncharacterized protein n=1 Tax=Amphimedon queenslandica TaxID=400682 RepID=A0A1X7U3B2_AMPQE
MRGDSGTSCRCGCPNPKTVACITGRVDPQRSQGSPNIPDKALPRDRPAIVQHKQRTGSSGTYGQIVSQSLDRAQGAAGSPNDYRYAGAPGVCLGEPKQKKGPRR